MINNYTYNINRKPLKLWLFVYRDPSLERESRAKKNGSCLEKKLAVYWFSVQHRPDISREIAPDNSIPVPGTAAQTTATPATQLPTIKPPEKLYFHPKLLCFLCGINCLADNFSFLSAKIVWKVLFFGKMSAIAQQESLVKESLFQFITKIIPSADLSAIDDIVLSYVISILEEASQDPCFDVEGEKHSKICLTSLCLGLKRNNPPRKAEIYAWVPFWNCT